MFPSPLKNAAYRVLESDDITRHSSSSPLPFYQNPYNHPVVSNTSKKKKVKTRHPTNIQRKAAILEAKEKLQDASEATQCVEIIGTLANFLAKPKQKAELVKRRSSLELLDASHASSSNIPLPISVFGSIPEPQEKESKVNKIARRRSIHRTQSFVKQVRPASAPCTTTSRTDH